MPFENQRITSTIFSGTTIDATGGAIFSGSSELSTLFISKPRKLISSNHNIVGLVQGSGSTTETIFEQYSFPSATFKGGDTLEFWWCAFYSSSTGSGSKTLRIRIGTAGTTSDAQFVLLATTSANINLNNMAQLCFVDNFTFESANVGGTSFWNAPTLSYVSASTLNLSASTTYVSITGSRTTLSADTVSYRWFDIYRNSL